MDLIVGFCALAMISGMKSFHPGGLGQKGPEQGNYLRLQGTEDFPDGVHVFHHELGLSP
jgi:hypothetical protein